MEIIIGYILGFTVIGLFLISLVNIVSNRIKNSRNELTIRINNLENRIKDLEERR
jgi:hypothetical protein